MAPLIHALLCSANPHKLDELRAALPGWTLELLEADGYPEETGASYSENARAKAAYGRSVVGADAWLVGEDSGIEVAAVGGAPGLHSARWAGDGVARLLRELDGVAEREARYVCALVCLTPVGELAGRGILAGGIATGRRGAEGFGYDPVFVPEGEVRTVAELGNAWKRRHSHRALAAADLARAADSAL